MDQTINEMEKYVDKLNEVYSSLNIYYFYFLPHL